MEISTIYNPHQQSEKELLDGFVIRRKEFETIFSDIQRNKMQTPSQHYIIYGIRGNGKTSLLLKLFYETRNHKKLNKWLVPIIFQEEQYSIRTLAKLWEGLAEYLADEHDEFSDLLLKMDAIEDEADYEEKCFELLQESLNANNKKLVLFFDNFGVFLKKLKNKEHQRLREVLMTCSELRIVGASTFVDEVTYDYGKPFFDFFKPVTLKGLDKQDTIRLLEKLDEKSPNSDVKEIIKTNPGRIEALRRLTGGIPRTMVLLYQIFVESGNGTSFKDLETVLDKVTPLYKARMDELPPQQQEIADIIAKNWDAITVKEIVAKAKMPSNAVSAQLKQLEKNRIIIKKRTSTKNNLYQLSERFFNIWYLMRFSRRKEKCKVRWLVQFLEIWCSKDELTLRAKKHLEYMQKGNLYDKYAYHMSEAYAQAIDSSEMQHKILITTKEYFKTIKSDYLNQLSDSDIELENEAQKYYEEEKPELTLSKLLKIERKNKIQLYNIGFIYDTFKKDNAKAEQYYLMAVEMGDSGAMSNLGLLYQNEFKDNAKAEQYYLMAVEKGHIGAMFNLGNLYKDEFKDNVKAEQYYLMAVEKGKSEAMFNLGLLYQNEFKDNAKAEKYYLMAVEKGDSEAMFNLGNLYKNEFKDNIKAEKYYLMAVEKGNLGAMFNLGNLYYDEFKDNIKAEKYYLMAVKKGDSGAMINLGNLYKHEFKDNAKAEQYYLMAVEKGQSEAMFNLGNLYKHEFKDNAKAEQYYLMAVEKGDSAAMVNLGNLYKQKFKDNAKAEKYYLMAVEKEDFTAYNSIAWFYFELKRSKKEALKYVKQTYENDRNVYSSHTYSCILLWHNEIERAIEVSIGFMNNEESYEQFSKDIELFLLLLIAKKQHHYVHKLFDENKFNIKDRYKPIYYALMHLMQDEYPDEIKKMGSELEETVKEILEKIEKLAEDYK